MRGDDHAVRLLLQEPDIEINARSGASNRSAFDFAFLGGHLEVVELLLGKGAYISYVPEVILRWGNERGSKKIVDLMIGRGRIQGEALERADHNEMVELLLDKEGDIKAYGAKAAVKAGRNGNLDIVKTLLGKGLDISSCGTAFETAASAGHAEMLQLLVEKGIDPKVSGEKALNGAVGWGQNEVVKVLLSNGVGSGEALQQATENRRRLIVSDATEMKFQN
ncbi:hypothetical protein TWF506_009510 [Arthrobotrys conoides]|uniref:Ankyrin n=1 Tax=Arthrobotrys conoides TaxID=74498 RepID=A0AAN8RSN1_9PEZI